MNREQKAAAVAEIAESLRESEAVFAVDFRGISVPQAADLRTRLRDADATFRVVKNSLPSVVDEAGRHAQGAAGGLTARTFVRGDAALAAKAPQTRRDREARVQRAARRRGPRPSDPALARLPARDVLYGQLVGMWPAHHGLVRTLNALIAGLA
jgi:large subunit ribosomal protein L10